MINAGQFLERTDLLNKNFVLFRDHRRAYYQRGLTSQLQSFSAFLEWHDALASSLHHVRKRYCVGTSMGAYAAIQFGHLLVVDSVWAFGGQTLIPSSYAEDGSGSERCDLAVLLSKWNGKTRFKLYYNWSHEPDRCAAERLRSCGGVALYPQEGDGHFVVATLIANGVLDSLFQS